jgi:large subunit ribosomal protein L17
MRHRKAGRQFGRNTSHRRAMFRALTANLVAHERIETTETKAKELRRIAERLITRAIRLGPIAYAPHAQLSQAERARRQAAKQRVGSFLRRFADVPEGEGYKRVDLVEKVFIDLAKRYRERKGGYTRIVKVGRRRGDNAPMSIIELVDSEAAARAAAPKPKAEQPKAEEPKAAAAPAAEEPVAEAKAEEKAAPAAAEQPEAGPAEATSTAEPDEAEAKSKKKAAKKTTKKAAATAEDDAPADEAEAKPKKKAAKKTAKKAAAKAEGEEKPKKKAAKKKATKKE